MASSGSPSTAPGRGHPARWAALAVGVVVAAIAVVLALEVHSDPLSDVNKSRLVGKAAPRFDLPTLTSGRIRSSDLAGKSVIVNFWNSWCIPCRQEHPALVAFYRQHQNDPGFVMVGIVRDDTPGAIRAYVRTEGVPYVVAFDPESQASLGFGTRGQPETYAISPTGVIVGSKWGPSSIDDLNTLLRAAS